MNTKVTQLSKISNTLFLISTITILNFIWINYYLRNFNLSSISSIIITIAISIIIIPIYKHLTTKKTLATSTKENKENLKYHLLLSSNTQAKTTINSIFNIQTKTNSNTNHTNTQNKSIYYIFNKEQLSQEDIYSILKSTKSHNIDIYCIQSISNPILPQEYQITIITLDNIYSQYCKTNISNINLLKIKKSSKTSLKSILCIVLSKNNSKKYLKLSLLLLISSIFIPYNIYYICISTLLIFLSIYSRFNKKFN